MNPPDTLADRGLVLEHKLYPAVVKAFLEGRVRQENGRAVMDDATARELAIFA